MRRLALLAVLLGATGCEMNARVHSRYSDYCRGEFALARTVADSQAAAKKGFGTAADFRSCSEYLGHELRRKQQVTP